MGNPNAPYRPGEWASLRTMEIAGAALSQQQQQQQGGGDAPPPPPRGRRARWFQREDRRAALRWGGPGALVAALAAGMGYLLAVSWGDATGNARLSSSQSLAFISLTYVGLLIGLLSAAGAAHETGRVRSGMLAARHVAVLWTLAVALIIIASNGDFQTLRRGANTDLLLTDGLTTLVFVIIGALAGMLTLGVLGGLIGYRLPRG